MKNYRELSNNELKNINGGGLIFEIFKAIGKGLVREGRAASAGNWTSTKYGSWQG
ncbi:bacteriocin [uncultured Tenacibaculum sp.]|uniref:bacteriocin n=1 Tax=uncultured Tenacibaculum sp. TaxID=174713 RepID=UPI0026134A79|nr:bacteriocin [uncultured Tenacibaculum sp.]